VQSTRAALPEAGAKIVFDKFHVVKHLHDAVDKVRRAEHRALKRGGDERLTGSKYLWLLRPQHMSPAQRQAFKALQGQDFKVARAWALKERFRTFWEYRYPGAARTFFQRWYWRASHSRLRPVAAVAKLIRRHLPNLLTYLHHRLTNAGLEGVNAVIQWVKKTARGFRNPEHFKTGYLLPLRRPGPLPTRKPVEPLLLASSRLHLHFLQHLLDLFLLPLQQAVMTPRMSSKDLAILYIAREVS
jgi:transposase